VKDDHFIPFRSVFETEEQITLQRLMIERRVIRQKFQNFVYNEMRNLHVNALKYSLSNLHKSTIPPKLD